MKGVNDDHVLMIEKLQPYSGAQWTARLQEISNPDKHRELAYCQSLFDGKVNLRLGQLNEFEGKKGKVYTVDWAGGRHLYLESHLSLHIALEDQTPALYVMRELWKEVGDTLNAFKPEFRRHSS